MKQRIALVEDEPALAASYRDLLNRSGYGATVFTSASAARAGLADCRPDLVLLDIGLGDDREAGFALCQEIRAADALLPIVFLTARDADVDVISGLRLGADDYLTKDISHAHLMARITALLRRHEAIRNPENREQVLRRGALELNSERLTTRWQDHSVELTFTEFWMVAALARHTGHIKSREQLMQAAHVVLDDSTITSHVRRIRKKFQQVDPNFKQLETAYGLGYRWCGEE
ncbi:MAG: response regulator [Cellvibrionales bacterium]|jgi:two-component system OmpR family response regulator